MAFKIAIRERDQNRQQIDQNYKSKQTNKWFVTITFAINNVHGNREVTYECLYFYQTGFLMPYERCYVKSRTGKQ